MADENEQKMENGEKKEEKSPLDSEEVLAKKQERPPKQITITDIELEKIKQEANEYKDKYLRLLAETENTRKRLQKERQELTKYAVENAVVDFLSPIDNLENALKFATQMSEEVKHWALGFQMILNQLREALANNDVIPFDAKGAKFDPHLHEAIEMIETNDVPQGTIMEESVKGYKMGDRIVRAARVKVAKSKNQGAENGSPKEENSQMKNKE